MDYAIIKKMAALTAYDGALDEKLIRAARLFLRDSPFDQCAIYRWGKGGAERAEAFILKAKAGERKNCPDAYGADEGLPGAARKKRAAFAARKRSAAGKNWGRIEDRGGDGYKSAFVCPLRSGNSFYGVVYLKSKRGARLRAAERLLIEAAALELVSSLRCAELVRSHDRAHRDLNEVQERLLKTEKLIALGDMAATLAHEIKNPLLSIGAFAARLKRRLGPDSDLLPYVEQMIAEIVRLEKIMNGVVRFLRDSAPDLKPDDLNAILDEALGLFGDEIAAHGVNVVKDFYPEPLPLLADREQLKIAFDNLIANAIQSMEKGGTLTLSTARTAHSVIARVSDTGGGIDPRYIGHIFNPFFTTKEHGTGLGLPITNSIVMRHRGTIEIDNRFGAGATFTLIFPYGEEAERP